ncbi:MAG: V-type ATP synthase subunit I [Desulfobaccales bacterium]
MIARMEKLFLVGPKRLAPRVLSKLQQAGVVQVDPVPRDQMGEYRLEPEAETRLRRWEAVLTSVAHASSLLELELDAAVAPFPGDLEDMEATAASLEQRAALLMEKRERLKDELQLIHQYLDVLVHLAAAVQGLDRSSRLSVIPFVVEKGADLEGLEQELAAALNDRVILAQETVGQKMVAVIITLKKEVAAARGMLHHAGLAELPRLKEYARMDLRAMARRLTARSNLNPQEIAGVEEELRQLSLEAAPLLGGIRNRAGNEVNRLKTLKALASGRYGAALFGWAPASQRDKVVGAMRPFAGEILYTFEPAEEHEEPERIPVMLENPQWIKPFESLISFLHTPRYDSWDPTWITATLFPLWFGMIVGDAGYGLVFLGIAWYLSAVVRHHQELRLDFFKMRLAPKAVEQLVRMMKPMIIWTILFGLLYGEFFGNLLQQLQVLGTKAKPGLLPILIPRTETVATATTLILVSLGFGIIQVLHGFILKAQLARRHGEKKPFWEACGFFGGTVALIFFGYAFMSKNYPSWLLIPMFGGAALFLWGMIRARTPLMMVELPTQCGHILSYLRLYAVGLASAMLADLSTDIGFAFFQVGGVTGLIAGVLVGLLLALMIHASLIVLLTISHVLQPLRLLWVEFFTKFDFYTCSGRPYRPFKLMGSQNS